LEYENDISACLRTLGAGGVILYPTDTVWGLGCDATNETAVTRIFSIKERPSSKSMIVLLAEDRDLPKYIKRPDPAAFDYLAKAARPTTIIYEGVTGLAGNLVAADGSVAIRIVQDPFCRQLIERFGKPIVSTSANISGEKTPSVFREIDQDILHSVDYAVQYRRADNSRMPASSVVRFDKQGRLIILRP
jgi:L-threonylcarbamoyladenylate synthase